MAQYHKTPELSVSSVFKLRPEELELFFLREHQKMPDNAGERRECLTILEKVDWKDGLLAKLVTDAETGIIGDVKDIKRRKKFFGANERSLPTVRSFWAVLWDQFDEFYVLLLLIFASISLVVSFFQGIKWKWLEAVSIYFAVLFAAFIQTLCDWGKEKQFLRLRREVMNEKCTVLRGQYGTSQTVMVSELVVGDIVLLSQGDRVPADCILIEEMDMHVDQKQFFPTQENSELTTKQCSYNSTEKDIELNPDNVLLQDSMVMTGTGKAVVMAVGAHTFKEKEIIAVRGAANALMVEEQETPLQIKLRILSEIIGAYAYIICIVSLILFGICWLLFVMVSDHGLVDGWSIQRAIELASTAIALLIVCIPEGMPLVISMAMAFSVDNLKKENLLIKNLDALEMSGQVVDILTGKTATLTTGDMQVARINVVGQTQNLSELEANMEVLNTLNDCIVLNCDAHMQMKNDTYAPVGSPVEVGLLQMLIDRGVAVQDKLIERERDHELKLWIPFSSDRKRMTVAYRLKDSPDVVRVVVKGAPENLIPMCSAQLDQFNQAAGFDGQGEEGSNYLEQVVINQLIIGPNQDPVHGINGLKSLTIAYRDFNVDDFQGLLDSNNNFEDEASRYLVESDLTLIASVGLDDPMREMIDDAFEKLNEGNTNVRVISGDHKVSAMYAAIKMGMLDDLNQDEFVFSSDQVLAELNTLLKETEDLDEGRGKTYVFQNQECLTRFRKTLKKKVLIVYRATPELKHKLVCALRQSKSIVAVTGEGLSDARAISEANVGFAMGEDGCSAAKDHADIILTDDNFLSVVNAIRWGRNIQDNVRKFIMFQMTVNVTCLIFVISTTLVLCHSPFNIVQLLWINLIMDVLAAIAFSTENPHPTDIRKERIKDDDKLITPLMMRSILFQSGYQLLVMIILLYAGPAASNISYDLYNSDLTNLDGSPSYRLQHQTFMFHCFVMMSLFNMVNCRVLGAMPVEEGVEDSGVDGQQRSAVNRKEFNIFSGIHRNWWFLIILLGELNLQYFMVGYAAIGKLFATTPLTFGMHLTAVLLGLGSWIICALMKVSPPSLLKKMPEFGEDEAALNAAKASTQKYQKLTDFEAAARQNTDQGDENANRLDE